MRCRFRRRAVPPLITDYARATTDTGSPEVQVALISQRITNLTEHLKTPRQGFPQPAWPVDAGRPPAPLARLPQEKRPGPLHHPDHPAQPAPLTGLADQPGAMVAPGNAAPIGRRNDAAPGSPAATAPLATWTRFQISAHPCRLRRCHRTGARIARRAARHRDRRKTRPHVQSFPQRHRVGRTHAQPGDGQDRPAGRWRRPCHLWRDDRAVPPPWA